MKNLIIVALSTLLFVSCKITQVAKFTSVENLYKLQLGSSLDDVTRLMGSNPYNILSHQVDGYTIYTYKYKLIERQVSPKLVNNRGGETVGTEVYGKENTVFLIMKNNKLESFMTTDGRNDSQNLIMLNNTLYTISQDKGKYVLIPTEIKSEKQELFNPLMKGRNKRK
jgi:hypothetical protein